MKTPARSSLILAIPIAVVFATLATLVAATPDDGAWTVHEWGTFTCLQDETGRAIGGINVDDEPLPAFVHSVAKQLNVPATDLPVNSINKGLPFNRHSYLPVTMRLETPVLYFHPPSGARTDEKINVDVAFNGGWLSEFYPRAEATAPGIGPKGSIDSDLTDKTVGALSWTDLTVGGDTAMRDTKNPVWLAPRRVNAANVTTADGEGERYLFYRGVGHLDSPLKVVRGDDGNLSVYANEATARAASSIPACWLVCIRADKSLAFQELGAAPIGHNNSQPLYRTSASFNDSAFRDDALPRLKLSMQKALVDDGLYEDEAKAMLATWEAAYFKTPGTRLFYLVPQTWTDTVLPIRISVPSAVDRVMVGRIEIVTPGQRTLLKRIAATTSTDPNTRNSAITWLNTAASGFDVNRDRDLNVLYEKALNATLDPAKVPENYKAYLALGRFRDALLLDYFAQSTADERTPLQRFLTHYAIKSSGFRPTNLAQAR